MDTIENRYQKLDCRTRSGGVTDGLIQEGARGELKGLGFASHFDVDSVINDDLTVCCTSGKAKGIIIGHVLLGST